MNSWFVGCNARDKRMCKRFDECMRASKVKREYELDRKMWCLNNNFGLFMEKPKEIEVKDDGLQK